MRWKEGIIDLPRVDQTEHWIDFAPWPEYIDNEGVIHFQKNDSQESKHIETLKIKPDIVVYATGYSHRAFPFLSHGYPHSDDANVRSLWKGGDETVAFIGFIRPQLGKISNGDSTCFHANRHRQSGAIPPLAEFQAQLWVLRILNLLPQANLQSLSLALGPEVEYWYKLKPPPGARVRHGVDHECYAYQLALDIGSAPSVFDIAKHGWQVFIAWACGANFNTKFRIIGPWKWDGAVEVMRTEMWTLITRRPFFWGKSLHFETRPSLDCLWVFFII